MKNYTALALALLLSTGLAFGATRSARTKTPKKSKNPETSTSLSPEDAAAIKRTLDAIRVFIEKGEPIDKAIDWDMDEDWSDVTREGSWTEQMDG